MKKYRAQFATMPPGIARAYAIVNAVAWELRDEGAGLFAKPSGNAYNGVSTDIIIYKSGFMFDVLGDAENAATPQWNTTGPDGASGHGDTSKWRAPVAPQGTPAPPTPTPVPTPTPSPAPAAPNYTAVLTRIAVGIEAVAAQLAKVNDVTAPALAETLKAVEFRVKF